MKRSEIISRIKEIVREKRTNGVLNMIDDHYAPDGFRKKILYIRNGKLYLVYSYTDYNKSVSETYSERQIYKFKLAAILYEIGNEKDRSLVRDDVIMQDYAYLLNKLYNFG
jgi:hypothetical protein